MIRYKTNRFKPFGLPKLVREQNLAISIYQIQVFFDGIALHMYLQLETLLVVLINKKDSGNRRIPSSELLFLHVGRIISSCVTIVLPSVEINIEK